MTDDFIIDYALYYYWRMQMDYIDAITQKHSYSRKQWSKEEIDTAFENAEKVAHLIKRRLAAEKGHND